VAKIIGTKQPRLWRNVKVTRRVHQRTVHRVGQKISTVQQKANAVAKLYARGTRGEIKKALGTSNVDRLGQTSERITAARLLTAAETELGKLLAECGFQTGGR